MTPSFLTNVTLRSIIWFGLAVGLALIKKSPNASIVSLRTDGAVWLGGGILLSGLVLHLWSTLALARGEWRRTPDTIALVSDGPFRLVRHPMYLAGILMLLGVGLLYPSWKATDLVLPLGLLGFFHVAVVRVEEPELRRRLGASYDEYCAQVPRWLPRRPGSAPSRF